MSVVPFEYASPKFRIRPDRRIPDFNDIADQLKTFLNIEAKRFDTLLLVAHSQGGLIVQRYLARMLAQGKGQDLAAIGGVVLFACPNDGSSFALSLRTSLWQRRPQEAELRPLNDQVKDAQRIVVSQVVNATTRSMSTCPIPFWVYGGTEDKVVGRASAQGPFPDVAMLPGDHFSIIKTDSRNAPAYRALREHLLEVQARSALPATATLPAGNPEELRPSSAHPGDHAKAERITRVLPVQADWLVTLRNQDLFIVSGRVNRLFLDAVDALRNDPIWFVDPALDGAERSARKAAEDLGAGMIEHLFADKIDSEMEKRLPLEEREDAVTFVVGEYQRGERELRLHELRDAFFQTYDVLVRLLNERLLLPGQGAGPHMPSTFVTKVEGDEGRVAGSGARRNAFGNRSSVKGDGQDPFAANEQAGSDTVVRGNRNRVAGAGAHDNAFGDDAHVDNT